MKPTERRRVLSNLLHLDFIAYLQISREKELSLILIRNKVDFLTIFFLAICLMVVLCVGIAWINGMGILQLIGVEGLIERDVNMSSR